MEYVEVLLNDTNVTLTEDKRVICPLCSGTNYNMQSSQLVTYVCNDCMSIVTLKAVDVNVGCCPVTVWDEKARVRGSMQVLLERIGAISVGGNVVSCYPEKSKYADNYVDMFLEDTTVVIDEDGILCCPQCDDVFMHRITDAPYVDNESMVFICELCHGMSALEFKSLDGHTIPQWSKIVRTPKGGK